MSFRSGPARRAGKQATAAARLDASFGRHPTRHPGADGARHHGERRPGADLQARPARTGGRGGMDRGARLRIPLSKKSWCNRPMAQWRATASAISRCSTSPSGWRRRAAFRPPSTARPISTPTSTCCWNRQGKDPHAPPELLPDFVINGRCKAPAAAQDQNCRTGCVCAVPEALDQNPPLGVGTVNCCRVDWAVATENKEMMKAAIVILNRRMKHDRTEIKSRDSSRATLHQLPAADKVLVQFRRLQRADLSLHTPKRLALAAKVGVATLLCCPICRDW